MLLKGAREYSGIYLATGATDLRKAVDGLSHIVKQDFQMDPFGNYYTSEKEHRQPRP